MLPIIGWLAEVMSPPGKIVEPGRGTGRAVVHGMNGMLRFTGAVKRDPVIDVWLNERALGALVQRWFSQMRECGDDVRELMHDGCPTACVGDAPFGYVHTFTAHANVGFFYGSELPDPAGLLEGAGKRMRHVKLRPGADLDSAALSALIDAAYADIQQRLKGERHFPLNSSSRPQSRPRGKR